MNILKILFLFLICANIFSTENAFSAEKRTCHVDVNLNCKDPVSNGSFGVLSWAPRTATVRKNLYMSEQVQNSYRGCVLFAVLMKSECGIKDPVVLVFGLGEDKPSVTEFIIKAERNLSMKSKLPPAFENYFNGR